MFSSYRVGSQDLQVWLSRLQQLGHHVQETLHEGFDALRVTRHQQLVQSLHGYHHIPAHSNKLYTHDTGAFQHLQVYRNLSPGVCHRGRGLSRDTQTLPNPLHINVPTEQFSGALLYLKTEAKLRLRREIGSEQRTVQQMCFDQNTQKWVGYCPVWKWALSVDWGHYCMM